MPLRRRCSLVLALAPVILLSLVTAVLAQRVVATESDEQVVVELTAPV
ncbi:MAG: hypothetical protein AB7I59_01095 [Geminicoccaceae bacterium]